MGNPLLDISATVDADFLAKYKLEANNAILAEEAHQPIYAEVCEKFKVEYIAGGATQNSIRVAQWMLQEPSTSYIGCVGQDEYAKTLREAASAGGTNVCYMEKAGTPTGTCAVLITGDNRSLVANISAANEYDISHLKSTGMPLVEAANFYYISGFFLTVPGGVPSIMEVAQHAAAEGKTFMMNLGAPFICQFFKDPLVAALPYCDIVFGNETEYEELAKSLGWDTTDLKVIAKKVAAMQKSNGARARIAICTHGAEPTIIATEGGVTEYPIAACTKEEIIDTNGAGDAWVGGFLAGLVKGKSIEECTKAGAYAAKVIIGRSGCTYPATPAYLL